ncbi:MAG TPA: hypothetical protein VFS39_00545 [Nitrospira sp.]|nr:hypothetical protein [Nitrospira sp.]
MSDTKELVERLRSIPLYEGYGEESDLPEQAADALEAKDREIAELRGTLELVRTRVDVYRDRFREEAARAEALAAKLEKAKAAISSVRGYMTNAVIDLQTGTKKQTTINTLNGGLRISLEALEAIDAS